MPSTSGHTTGPPAENACAVEPVAVAATTPSQPNDDSGWPSTSRSTSSMRERSTFSSAASLSAHPVPVLPSGRSTAHVQGAALLDVELARGQATHGLADVLALALGEEPDVPEVHAQQRHGGPARQLRRPQDRPVATEHDGELERRQVRRDGVLRSQDGLDAGSFQLADGVVGGRHGLLAAAVGDDQGAPGHGATSAVRQHGVRDRVDGHLHRVGAVRPGEPQEELDVPARSGQRAADHAAHRETEAPPPHGRHRRRRRPTARGAGRPHPTRAARARPRTGASPSPGGRRRGAPRRRARGARGSAR